MLSRRSATVTVVAGLLFSLGDVGWSYHTKMHSGNIGALVLFLSIDPPADGNQLSVPLFTTRSH